MINIVEKYGGEKSFKMPKITVSDPQDKKTNVLCKLYERLIAENSTRNVFLSWIFSLFSCNQL